MENRNPETVEELYSLGSTFLEGQDWQNAIKCFKGVLAIDPKHEGATAGRQEAEKQLDLADSYGKGQKAFDDGMWEKAIEHFERVASLDADYCDVAAKSKEAKNQSKLSALYELGSGHYQKEEWSKAIDIFQEVVFLSPRYRYAAAMLATAREKKRLADDIAIRNKTLAEYYTLGLGSYNTEDWENAIKRFKQVVELEPGYKDAAIKLKEAKKQLKLTGLYRDGTKHFDNKEWGKAVKKFKRIASLSPNYKDAAAKLKEAEERLKVERGKGPDWPRLATIGSAVVGIVVFIAALVEICSWIWPEFPLKRYLGASTSTSTPTLTSTSRPTLTPALTATDTPPSMSVPINTATTPSAPTSTSTPTPTPTAMPTPTPTPTAMPTPIPMPTAMPTPPDAVVNTELLNLHDGPDEVYDVLGTLKRGDFLKIKCKCPYGEWLEVTCPSGQEGWVEASLLEINLPLADVAVELLPPPTLLEPENDANFTESVLLKWQWYRPLMPDEFSSVRAYKEGETEFCHHSQVQGLEYSGDLDYCFSAGKHYWGIAVSRRLCEDCPEGEMWQKVSKPSAERWIYYTSLGTPGAPPPDLGQPEPDEERGREERDEEGRGRD